MYFSIKLIYFHIFSYMLLYFCIISFDGGVSAPLARVRQLQQPLLPRRLPVVAAHEARAAPGPAPRGRAGPGRHRLVFCIYLVYLVYTCIYFDIFWYYIDIL